MTLLLTRADVASLLDLDECVRLVEDAFRMHGEGRLVQPGILGVHTTNGGFHIKAALLPLSRSYFAAKINGNFFGNSERFRLPNIQGLIFLADGENGSPLAVMDSIEITIVRTGAATAVAAKCLARADSRIATICGCGNQGRIQLRALMRVLQLEHVYAFDLDFERARRFAEELSPRLAIAIEPVRHAGDAVLRSDVCVTCTPARGPIIMASHVRRGTFIAAVGADSAEKSEIDPAIFSSSKVVADIIEQCVRIGDIHHAIETGAIAIGDVHAELGEILCGRKTGRVSDDEVTIFDSTGAALQDVAAAAVVYERAIALGRGQSIAFDLPVS